ncbi:DUF2267 domain-containing protein [Halomonas sp. McH1-25]|uniref:DUF2267 domain-containing protein n=1 Tax=unclassified Halomonas TaxID=2609666 RepID=UPI001EF5B3D2|nr:MULTISPECIES: DUF2267 domain-containing protein [unclassified Halomonas]MCG7600928.1 DUF2267 domain-containing protein [Halomonas sp. McH1-25]MCP1341516.1 DUF2267 domain-containing protein [Halomonas sp. FL8]MCP1359798.1 DUF2267 domain-containing protein [Halomonas sp. BBD45]MCP1364255.1 DUF2267 domain-containing protein [Halomonas sp. BBD48]
MSDTGLQVFDRTLHTTNIWLGDIMEDNLVSRQTAWHALGAVLRCLRDRLPLPLAVHLGTQLPLLIRGSYYERWQPSDQPDKVRTREEFLQQIDDELAKTNQETDTADTTRVVFATVAKHIDPGQVEKIKEALPKEIQALW